MKIAKISLHCILEKRLSVLLIKLFDVREQNTHTKGQYVNCGFIKKLKIFSLPVLNNLLSEITLLVFGKAFYTLPL